LDSVRCFASQGGGATLQPRIVARAPGATAATIKAAMKG
jgi:hypothetical protein